ncbi:MAG: hypothetical protein VX316_05655 [Actinomycetota bacterium]|nr:hypothetical protein [Actinomycetota bacterium]
MFDTLITVIEHLYAEYMFPEQTFHVKDPMPASGPACHTRSSGWITWTR